MKFITGNRKTRKQWNDNIVDTKKDFNIRNINQHSDGTNHPCYHNDSVSDSETTPQFQSEINRKNYDIQKDVVQNFSRFNSIRKHLRIDLV